MSTKKNLLMLGGGALNIQAVKEARENGFYVIVADGNPHAPAFEYADVAIHADISSADAIAEKISPYTIDGIVSMAEVGVLPGAILNERLHLNGIRPETALLATSKAGMRTSWSNSAYSVDFRVIKTFEEALVAMNELGEFPLIVKPDRTYGGSRGVSKINASDELQAAFEFAKANGLNEYILIEQCAQGEEFSCEVIVDKAQAYLLCVGQKIKSPLPYRVDCSVQYPARLDEHQLDEVRKMTTMATQKLGITDGVAHIEFAMTADGPRLFELGARCGGGHTPLIARHVSNVNEFICYARIACGEEPLLQFHNKSKGADYRFIIFHPGQITHIEVEEWVSKHPGVYDLVITAKAGDEVKALRTTSERSGALVTFGETFEEAIELADRVCRSIHVSYADGLKETAKLFA
ncbi:MAG: ATP-grasp domain-containing protein [Bacteroidia bacterium]|nr:ATP-grasp domain-containing protein [Bacteroidia bacterium]